MLLFFYCRAGFEVDCAAEVSATALAAGAEGECEYRDGDAYVLWRAEPGTRGRAWAPAWDELVFARQVLAHCEVIDLGGVSDRLAAIIEHVRSLGGRRFQDVSLEAPDADRPRQLLAGSQKLSEALQTALREAGVLAVRQRQRLHVVLLARDRALIGVSSADKRSPWAMGIPRLRFPAGAPSRSGLKLLEALALFIGEDALPGRMRAGRVAIDLGAAPGGWSQVLASRGLRVVAVDNGPIARQVLETQLVEHRREDAFRFRPDLPVDWMVCDVVAAPARIAALVAQWIARRWCRETIFNLKLPTRSRWQEVQRCHDVIERTLAASEDKHALSMKHLYHDRDEVTGHLRRL
jgi:23S rRNA (cytidine2498-2'-O)-methyltransferase